MTLTVTAGKFRTWLFLALSFDNWEVQLNKYQTILKFMPCAMSFFETMLLPHPRQSQLLLFSFPSRLPHSPLSPPLPSFLSSSSFFNKKSLKDYKNPFSYKADITAILVFNIVIVEKDTMTQRGVTCLMSLR